MRQHLHLFHHARSSFFSTDCCVNCHRLLLSIAAAAALSPEVSSAHLCDSRTAASSVFTPCRQCRSALCSALTHAPRAWHRSARQAVRTACSCSVARREARPGFAGKKGGDGVGKKKLTCESRQTPIHAFPSLTHSPCSPVLLSSDSAAAANPLLGIRSEELYTHVQFRHTCARIRTRGK